MNRFRLSLSCGSGGRTGASKFAGIGTILAIALVAASPVAAQPAPAPPPPTPPAQPAGTPAATPGTPPAAPPTPAVAPAANQDTEEAKAHFNTAQDLFVKGQFQQASDEFMQAYSKKPAPVFLYNSGVCQEKMGKLPEAISLFRRYLAESPNARDKAKVEERIATLEKAVASHTTVIVDKTPEKLSGVLFISSNPPGATIYLDNKVGGSLGETPWNGTLEGEHTVILEMKGFKPFEEKVSGQSGKIVDLRVGLSTANNLGWLEVRANIPGADVYIDDKGVGAVGRTPYASNIVQGHHKIIITKEAFSEETKEVDIEGGKVYTVEANLEKAPIGFVHVTGVAVEGSKVKIDGKVVCEQAPCRFQTKDGEHNLEISRPGMKTFERKLNIIKATETEMSVKMQPTQSKTDVIWNFAFAAVFVGGGVVLGLQANSIHDEIQSDINKGMPPVAPNDDRFLKGKLFSYGADALYVIGGITAITGVISLLRERGPSSTGTAETKDLSFSPVVGPNYAGATLGVRW